MSVHLVIGGARSGKSWFAQNLAHQQHIGDVDLIVTAEILDDEMAARVAKHRAERPSHWRVTEAPFNLPEAIDKLCLPGSFVIVDCLTLWLSNILCTQAETLESQLDKLCLAVIRAKGSLVIISNEVGWSIVPENALARVFRDEQGRLNQRIAAVANVVSLIAAGLPLRLKG